MGRWPGHPHIGDRRGPGGLGGEIGGGAGQVERSRGGGPHNSPGLAGPGPGDVLGLESATSPEDSPEPGEGGSLQCKWNFKKNG